MKKSVVKVEPRFKPPLLLGYSGGPDSKALLYALLDAGITPHLAHIDHGWRPESAEEARLSKLEAESLGCPFHTIRLDPPPSNEEAARDARWNFFRSLFAKIPFQALALGHQADDLAETVLKRVFEGAHLTSLTAMREISTRDGITIWRPLLSFSKRDLTAYLDQKQLTPFYDSTNDDPTFLRSRIRHQLLPFLNKTFGKEIASNLCTLSRRSTELDDYLQSKIAPLLLQVEAGPWGFYLGRELFAPLHPIEKRALIQKLRPLSREEIDSHLDKEDLLLLSPTPPHFDAPIPLEPGTHRSGSWTVQISEATAPLPLPHWREVWKGSFQFTLPTGQFHLALATPSKSLRDRWRIQRVPPLLRGQVPAIYEAGRLTYELLTGSKRAGIGDSDRHVDPDIGPHHRLVKLQCEQQH
jgi:tRNA(Ile)-lysidine synthase